MTKSVTRRELGRGKCICFERHYKSRFGQYSSSSIYSRYVLLGVCLLTCPQPALPSDHLCSRTSSPLVVAEAAPLSVLGPDASRGLVETTRS